MMHDVTVVAVEENSNIVDRKNGSSCSCAGKRLALARLRSSFQRQCPRYDRSSAVTNWQCDGAQFLLHSGGAGGIEERTERLTRGLDEFSGCGSGSDTECLHWGRR